MAEVLSGRAVAAVWDEWLKGKVKEISARIQPVLGIVQVGDDPASAVYVRNKLRAAERVGIKTRHLHLPATVTEHKLIDEIKYVVEEVTGLIVQLPLPDHLNGVLERLRAVIPPEKDVDGFGPVNMGMLSIGKPLIVPATPLGILVLMHAYEYHPQGKHVVVVGRSNIVGTPLSLLLSRNFEWANATVTLCHSRTSDIQKITREADILVVAIGKPNHVGLDWVRRGQVVIDVGIHRVDGRIVGDVDIENVSKVVRAYTPVPGGVGPLTVRGLLSNVVIAAGLQAGLRIDTSSMIREIISYVKAHFVQNSVAYLGK